MKLFVRFSWLILFWTLVSPLHADSDSAVIRSVQVGIEGVYKNGLWTPIIVHWSTGWSAPSEEFEFVVSCTDSDGTPITYRSPCSVFEERGTEYRSLLYAKLGRKTAALTVEIRRKNGHSVFWKGHPSGNPAKRRKTSTETETDRFYEPVASEKPVYLIVGNEDIGLQGAVAELSLREDRRPLLVKVESFDRLPTDWFGFEAIDMIVLTTTEPEQFSAMNAESPQIRALDEWIRLGGRLFLCAGKDSQPFLEAENGALRPFLPGRYATMTELRENAPLEVFVGSKRQIVMNGTEEAPFLKMPLFEDSRGITLLKHRDLTLVSRCAHGFGTIVYFGGDLAGRPLAPWRDRVALVRGILQWNTERPAAPRTGVSLIQLGYNDISGQVRSALDRFDDVRVVPFSLILIILVVYWLVVGPVDWFLVHKVLKRPVLTWITFPLWIVIFCGLAYYLAAPGRPNRAMMNELTLFDLDAETGLVRRSSWGNLYSPGDKRYDLKFCALENRVFSWNGLPGSGLGGMAPKTVSPTVWQSGAVQWIDNRSPHPIPGMEGVPVQVRSTKSFFGQSSMKREKGIKVDSQLADEEGIPVGQITLPQWTPILDDCLLVYGRWVLDLGTIEPGREIKVGKMTPRRELRDLLSSKEILEDAALGRLAGYNPQSTDLNYIARVLSLYGVLGGFDAVGLDNSFQRSLDMSDLFSVDRAILIGTVRSETASLGYGMMSQDIEIYNRTAICRQSLPITLTELSPRLKIEQREIKKDALADPDKTIDAGKIQQKEQSSSK